MLKNKILIISVASLLIGVGILIADIFVIKGTISFISGSEKAKGEVISLIKSRSSDDITIFSPEVSFTDATGKKIIFLSKISKNVFKYDIGEKVEVLYSKHNSQNAKINTFFQLWFDVIILSVVGMFFFLIGLFSFVGHKRKAL